MLEKLTKGSWKTTGLGIGALLVLLGNALVSLTDGKPETNVDWMTLIPAVLAAAIGIFARDNNKSSEAVGAVVAPVVEEPRV